MSMVSGVSEGSEAQGQDNLGCWTLERWTFEPSGR